MIDLFDTKSFRDNILNEPEKILELIENSQYGICITDQKGLIIAVNQLFSSFSEYEKEELTGKNYTKLVPRRSHWLYRSMNLAFFEQKRENSRASSLISKSGKSILFNIDERLMDNIQGQAYKISFIEPIGQRSSNRPYLTR